MEKSEQKCPDCGEFVKHKHDDTASIFVCPKCGWCKAWLLSTLLGTTFEGKPNILKMKTTCPGCGHPRCIEREDTEKQRYLCCLFCGKTVVQFGNVFIRFDNKGHTSRHNTGK